MKARNNTVQYGQSQLPGLSAGQRIRTCAVIAVLANGLLILWTLAHAPVAVMVLSMIPMIAVSTLAGLAIRYTRDVESEASTDD